jgi:L-lactate dehydrogenase complex protein LldE
MTTTHPRVALFVTCLVDLYRPTVGFAAVRLLKQTGCSVEVPTTQTCCGQPAYNSGDNATSADLARRVIEAFEPYDYTVAALGLLRGHDPVLSPPV